MKKMLVVFISIFLLLAACQSEPQSLRLATTTSTQDSGLLDVIVPDFEQQTGIDVEVIAVGTGEALALGSSGDADVVLVHARDQEDAFIAAGDGVERFDVMYNDFVVLGPESDTAGIRGMAEAPAALAQIAAAQAPFISRGDNSGTHSREKALWAAAGIEPAGDWYQSVGQGMGATLTIADEQQAYTLSDRATFIKRVAEGLGLVVLVEGDASLLNQYGVIAVNPEKHPGVNAAGARQFIDWMLSPETQDAIDAYSVNGQQLFFANAAR